MWSTGNVKCLVSMSTRPCNITLISDISFLAHDNSNLILTPDTSYIAVIKDLLMWIWRARQRRLLKTLENVKFSSWWSTVIGEENKHNLLWKFAHEFHRVLRCSFPGRPSVQVFNHTHCSATRFLFRALPFGKTTSLAIVFVCFTCVCTSGSGTE